MPDLRPVVTETQVLTLLNAYFTSPVTDLTPVEGGSVARTFAFRTQDQDYIIRFNLDKMLTSNFPKEAYLWQKLASTQIPIPPVVQVGRLGQLHFAISRKMLFQITVPGYKERLLCYQCYLTLDAMRFYAKSDQEQSYKVVRTRMLEKLK
jgi:fructosamine-3-kinase